MTSAPRNAGSVGRLDNPVEEARIADVFEVEATALRAVRKTDRGRNRRAARRLDKQRNPPAAALAGRIEGNRQQVAVAREPAPKHRAETGQILEHQIRRAVRA